MIWLYMLLLFLTLVAAVLLWRISAPASIGLVALAVLAGILPSRLPVNTSLVPGFSASEQRFAYAEGWVVGHLVHEFYAGEGKVLLLLRQDLPGVIRGGAAARLAGFRRAAEPVDLQVEHPPSHSIREPGTPVTGLSGTALQTWLGPGSGISVVVAMVPIHLEDWLQLNVATRLIYGVPDAVDAHWIQAVEQGQVDAVVLWKPDADRREPPGAGDPQAVFQQRYRLLKHQPTPGEAL